MNLCHRNSGWDKRASVGKTVLNGDMSSKTRFRKCCFRHSENWKFMIEQIHPFSSFVNTCKNKMKIRRCAFWITHCWKVHWYFISCNVFFFMGCHFLLISRQWLLVTLVGGYMTSIMLNSISISLVFLLTLLILPAVWL